MSMRGPLYAVLIGVSALVVQPPLRAHHAFTAVFDASKPVTLQGTVTKVEWYNPHAWIYIDVKSPDGDVVNYAVEGGSPNALTRRGWKKTTLAIGSAIVVDGFLAKDGTPTVNGKDITLPDGRTVFVGSSGTGAPYETESDR